MGERFDPCPTLSPTLAGKRAIPPPTPTARITAAPTQNRSPLSQDLPVVVRLAPAAARQRPGLPPCLDRCGRRKGIRRRPRPAGLLGGGRLAGAPLGFQRQTVNDLFLFLGGFSQEWYAGAPSIGTHNPHPARWVAGWLTESAESESARDQRHRDCCYPDRAWVPPAPSVDLWGAFAGRRKAWVKAIGSGTSTVQHQLHRQRPCTADVPDTNLMRSGAGGQNRTPLEQTLHGRIAGQKNGIGRESAGPRYVIYCSDLSRHTF